MKFLESLLEVILRLLSLPGDLLGQPLSNILLVNLLVFFCRLQVAPDVLLLLVDCIQLPALLSI